MQHNRIGRGKRNLQYRQTQLDDPPIEAPQLVLGQASVSQPALQSFEVFGAAKRRPFFKIGDTRRRIKLQQAGPEPFLLRKSARQVRSLRRRLL